MEKGMQGTATQAKPFYSKSGTGFRQRKLTLCMCAILIQNNFVTLHSSSTYLFWCYVKTNSCLFIIHEFS